LIASLLGAVSFWGLMKLSNDGIILPPDGANGLEKKWYLDHKYVELGIGFFGSLMYLFKK
jgi:hypothetical protein